MNLLFTFLMLLAFISACFAETEEGCKENHFFSVHKNRCFGMKFVIYFYYQNKNTNQHRSYNLFILKK